MSTKFVYDLTCIGTLVISDEFRKRRSPYFRDTYTFIVFVPHAPNLRPGPFFPAFKQKQLVGVNPSTLWTMDVHVARGGHYYKS